jgi:hypothetical protein
MQDYSTREQELIKQLSVSEDGKPVKLEYEELDGYEVPPRTQFSMLKKAAVSFKYKEMTFNTACVRLFEGIKYILPIVNRNKKRLAVIMCKEEESASVEWARLKKDVWVNKKITSLEFVENIFSMMDWDRNCRYKVLGRIVMSDRGLIVVFDLVEAIMYSALPEEYVDMRTGEIKKRKLAYYPDEYKGRIGKSYNDYVVAQQTSMFENLEGYTDDVDKKRGDGNG